MKKVRLLLDPALRCGVHYCLATNNEHAAEMVIELVYFTGCPNVELARRSLREALRTAGLPEHWQEWNQFDPSAPERVQGYASPTILVAGQNVTGDEPTNGAKACRIDGLASAETICAALLREIGEDSE